MGADDMRRSREEGRTAYKSAGNNATKNFEHSQTSRTLKQQEKLNGGHRDSLTCT